MYQEHGKAYLICRTIKDDGFSAQNLITVKMDKQEKSETKILLLMEKPNNGRHLRLEWSRDKERCCNGHSL